MLMELVSTHPVGTLLPASFALSFLSLSLAPSFISLIFLLTSLLLYTQDVNLLSHGIPKAFLLWITLTVSISVSHLAPSIHALSTPSISIASLLLLSGISSMVALAPVYIRHWRRVSVPDMQVLVFPTLWATAWLIVTWASPLGRLVTWSPLSGIESYRWIRVVFGFTGLDWISAAWASIVAEGLGNIIYEPVVEVSLFHDAQSVPSKSTPKVSRHLAPLTGLLLALTIPSFFVNTLPLPPSLSTEITPLPVACVLPQASEKSQLDRFLTETRSYASRARILLWPEGAVVFETEADRNQALEAVQNLTLGLKVWVGVSFEERVSSIGSNTREGQRRNGMVLVGPNGVEMTYYKRRLVPIAESFSQIASNEPPSIHTIDLPRPGRHGPSKEEWGNRSIPLSASICLDFSAPLTSLPSRPALVLAPAKTWHVAVGRAMYELARARGEEIGAEVLWCDGGAGGLSGIAGSVQVGEGTWVKTIGVPHPAEERRTLYGVCGDWLALAAMWGVPALFWAVQRNGGHIEQTSRSAIDRIGEHGRVFVARIRGMGRSNGAAIAAPQEGQLIDA